MEIYLKKKSSDAVGFEPIKKLLCNLHLKSKGEIRY